MICEEEIGAVILAALAAAIDVDTTADLDALTLDR
jgi:hypothetical protein